MRAAVTDQGPQLKPWIEAIRAYVPGKSQGSDGRALIKLSANENPLGSSPRALDARAAVGSPAFYPDPDSTALRQGIGALHGIDPARIVCGTGSGELIHCAAQAFAGPGDEVLFPRFSFSLYVIAARRCGATPVEAADADYAADVDSLLGAVNERTRIVILANPNNPTGTYMPRDQLARLHAALPADTLLLLDQAYCEYVDPADDDGGLALAAAHDNVLVTRTFSKIYGLAGERVGWATGAPQLIAGLNRLRGAFNVSLSGQAAATAALADQGFVAASREHNRAERARFVAAIEALGNHGLRVVPSQANFVLVAFEGRLTAQAALKALAERGYAVRDFPQPGLAHTLRITIGTREQMSVVADTLRELAEAAG